MSGEGTRTSLRQSGRVTLGSRHVEGQGEPRVPGRDILFGRTDRDLSGSVRRTQGRVWKVSYFLVSPHREDRVLPRPKISGTRSPRSWETLHIKVKVDRRVPRSFARFSVGTLVRRPSTRRLSDPTRRTHFSLHLRTRTPVPGLRGRVHVKRFTTPSG